MDMIPENNYNYSIRIKIESVLLFAIFIIPFVPAVIMLGLGYVNTTVIATLPLFIVTLLIATIIVKILNDGAIHVVYAISALDVLVVLYLCIGIIQVFNPNLPHLGYGARGFYEHLFWIVFYFITRFVYSANTSKISKIVYAVYIVSLLSAISGIALMLVGVDQAMPEWFSYQTSEDSANIGLLTKRSIGLLGSPFTYGLLCSFGLGAILSIKKNNDLHSDALRNTPKIPTTLSGQGLENSCLRKHRSRFWRIIPIDLFRYYIPIVILLSGIIIGSSRSVLLGTIIALLLCSIIGLRVTFRKRHIKLIFLVALSLLVLFGLYEYINENILFERILSLASIQKELNVQARYANWSVLIPYIINNPFGYGTGALGSATYAYGDVLGSGIADNNYIEILGEQGVFALIVLLLIVVVSIYYIYRSRKRNVLISQLALYIIAVSAVTSIGAPVLKAFVSNMFFWMVLGALSSVYINKHNPQKV